MGIYKRETLRKMFGTQQTPPTQNKTTYFSKNLYLKQTTYVKLNRFSLSDKK